MNSTSKWERKMSLIKFARHFYNLGKAAAQGKLVWHKGDKLPKKDGEYFVAYIIDDEPETIWYDVRIVEEGVMETYTGQIILAWAEFNPPRFFVQ